MVVYRGIIQCHGVDRIGTVVARFMSLWRSKRGRIMSLVVKLDQRPQGQLLRLESSVDAIQLSCATQLTCDSSGSSSCSFPPR